MEPRSVLVYSHAFDTFEMIVVLLYNILLQCGIFKCKKLLRLSQTFQQYCL